MTLDLVEDEIVRFLGDAKPEVLCVTGKWGVGKTYAWNRILASARAKSSVALKSYSYVSLFGQNSLAEIRSSIIENTVDDSAKEGHASPRTFQKTAKKLMKGLRKANWLASLLPQTTPYVAGASRLLYLAVRNQIICFDDLERVANAQLASDIMGLVSELKERKECKIVVLLNRSAMTGDLGLAFSRQIEKVSEVVISYEPSAKLCADIALDPDSFCLSRDLRAHSCSKNHEYPRHTPSWAANEPASPNLS